MSVTVFIRHRLDPSKTQQFESYAKRWLRIIPACDGDLVGYWMPHEGTNNIAYGLISFASLADYEAYRTRLESDAAGAANFRFAHKSTALSSARSAPSCAGSSEQRGGPSDDAGARTRPAIRHEKESGPPRFARSTRQPACHGASPTKRTAMT